MNDLKGRVALVTGGGRDVGAGISQALAEAGASVAVNYHSSRDEAEAVVAQIEKAGGKAKAYGADIADVEVEPAFVRLRDGLDDFRFLRQQLGHGNDPALALPVHWSALRCGNAFTLPSSRFSAPS